MTIDAQLIIKNNPYIYNYLRENSYWYKEINRNPLVLKEMEEEIKKYYRLNFSDKLNDLSKKINMLNMFMNILK